MAEAISQEVLARARQLQAQAQAEQEAQRRAAAEAAALEAERTRSNTWGEAAANLPIQALSSAVGLGQAAYGLGNMATFGLLDRAAGLSGNFQETQQILSGWQSGPTQQAAQNVQTAFDDRGILAGLGEAATSPAYLQQLLVGNAASLLPGAAAARAGAVAGAANATARGLTGEAAQAATSQAAQRALGRAVGGQVAGAVNVGTINAVEDAGGSELQQQLGGLGAGALAGVAAPALMRLTGAGALEAAAANALPGGAALGLGSGGIVRNVLGGAAREAAEEAPQSASERIAQNLFVPGADLFEGVGQAAAIGGLAGGLLGGGMGGAISLSTPRTSADTQLGAAIRDGLQRQNAEQGAPIAPSGLGDSPIEEIDVGATPLPTEEIDLGATPLPGEGLPLPQVDEAAVEEVTGAPAPLRSLYDITGRRPQVAPPSLPVMEVEEVAAPPREGLLGVLDAQRSRGQLGGTDLFAGALPAEGAFPQVASAPQEAPAAPASAPGQTTIDFNAPAPTWKKALARELGLKPQSLRGKHWARFEAAAAQAGIDPLSPEAPQFLAAVARDLTSDTADTAKFAELLATKYVPAVEPRLDDGLNNEGDPVTGTQDAQPGDRGGVTAPRTLQDALALTEDEYIQQVNPTGKVTDAEDTILVNRGDLSLPAETTVVEQFTDSQGVVSEVHADAEGNLYAVQNNEVVGELVPGADETLINVVSDAQGRGIGTGLAAALIRRDPFAQAGSFSPSGEATRRAAFRRVQEEAALALAPAPEPTNFAEPLPLGIDATIDRNLRVDPSSDRQQATADAYGDLIMDAASSDVLDQYFLAIKNHEGWDKLTDGQRDQLVNDFNLRYDALESGTARFDRALGERGPGMGIGQFSRLVSAANRNRPAGSPEVIGAEDVAGYETMTGHAAPPDARGVFSDGNIYLIRENLSNASDMANVLAHERGHAGLDALLGDRLPAIVNRLWTNAATRERIKAKMKSLNGAVDPEQGGLRRLAGEEVLADMLAGGEKVNGDILTKARAAVENAFASMLGISNLRMTNAEVDALLRDTAAVTRGVNPASIDMSKQHMQGLEFAMTDPASFVAEDPRFSRAAADIDTILAAATAEGEGSKRNIADVARETGADALQKVRGIGTATAADKARRFSLDLVPLNQMANLYDKYFDGMLGEFARLKRTKEATFNKLITGGNELNYQGEQLGELSPMSTANKIKAFAQKNPSRMQAWNQVQQMGTLYRLWPDRPMDKQSAINYETAGFSEAERAQAHADLQRLWKSVGPEGQRLYKETQAIYSFMWNSRFNALKADIARVMAPRTEGGEPMAPAEFFKTKEFKDAYGDRIESAMSKMRTGPYSPLQRYGNYLVTVRTADGKVEWFSGHDTIEEANAQRQQLLAGDYAGDGFTVSMPTLRREHNWELDGINQATINAIEKSVDGIVSHAADPGLHNAIREGLVEAYLQSLPQGAFMQHANRRKNTKGATTDAFRGFSDYTLKAARSVASLRYDGQITEKLAQLQTKATEKTDDENGIKRQRALEAVKRQHAASLATDRSPVADALSQAGFLWFMSSPSQIVINAMQTPMVTLPRLAGSYGNANALRGIKQALSDFSKSRGDMLGEKSVLGADSVERKVMQDLFERGTLDFSLSHDMSALANGEVGTTMSGHWRKALEVAGFFMNKSEVFNRQVVALAATRLEMQKRGLGADATPEQIAEVADAADSATLTTQFDYSQSNKPTVMQGPWRKVIFQFQQYRVNMLAMMGKDIRDSFTGTPEEKATARRALSWMLGTQLALTGAAGTVLAPMAFFIADLFRDDDDLLDSRTEFVRSAPQWLAHGALAGALDLSRVGADGLLTFGGQYAPAEASAKETFQHYVMQNIGPWAGLGTNIFTGIEKAMSGDHVAAAKALMPSGVGAAYKSLFEGQQGAKDARQIVYYEPGVWDTVAGTMGLRSGGRREAEETRGAVYEATARAQAVKSRYLGRLALGHATSDQEMINEAMEKVHEWNRTYPDQAIKGSSIASAVVSRARSQHNASQYGIPGAQPPARSILESVGL